MPISWLQGAVQPTNVVSVAFKETLSETALKNLLTKAILPENCKFPQAKLLSPVAFASVSPSIRSTDIKLQEVQRNMSKMTGCFIKLLSQLPNILKTNGDHKDEKLEAIQTILDGIKMSGHATQNLVSMRKKFLLSGVSSEYKDLAKFAEDTDSHLFGEELEDPLRKAKGRHYSLQALKPKTNYPHAHASSTKQNSRLKLQKMTGQLKDPWLATRVPHSTTPQVHGQN